MYFHDIIFLFQKLELIKYQNITTQCHAKLYLKNNKNITYKKFEKKNTQVIKKPLKKKINIEKTNLKNKKTRKKI